MISAQNLLQLLSGNSLCRATLLIAVLGLAACGGTNKAVTKTRSGTTRTKKVDIKPRVKENTTTKVDTVQWVEKTDPERPPIVDNEGNATAMVKEETYDLTYLLPLAALEYASGTRSYGDKFVQYFAGMEMAESILEREGINLNINVVDADKRSIRNVLTGSVSEETDAIVGLYDTKELKEAAAYAKEMQIPFVSPWKASSKIAEGNPYYVQLRPNLDEYYKTIVQHVSENYSVDQVYVLGRNTSKDKKMVKYMQRLGKAYYRSQEASPFTEFEVDVDSLAMGVTAFDSIFSPEQTNVVLIPNYSFSDEDYIYSAVRRLTVEKGVAKMVVYGMEIMLDSDKITFDQYNALNMKVARTKFVDEADGDVRRFKQKFYEVYGALPTADAYEGYDNLMFIGRNINRYGKNFQHHLEKDNGYYLQAAYDIQRTFMKGSADDNYEDINYFENKHIDIISFDGRRFHRESK